MNKKIFFFTALLIAVFSFEQINAQVISEKIKRKVTVGVDFFTDVWFNKPLGMETRTVNQGVNAFMQYNFYFNEKGTVAFGVGPGISNHNLYSNMKVEDIKADTINFVPIVGDYRRSKVNVVYIYIPMEVKFRFNHEVKFSIGFDFGWKIDSKQKIVINTKNSPDTKINIKEKNIDHMDKFTYGPRLRLGWKFVDFYAFYQINGIFEKGYGVDNLNYLSLGLSITPF
jgi:hypothetical protein